MKSITEFAEIEFKKQIAEYKAITGATNLDIAKLLGIDPATVSRMWNNPLSTSGKNVLLMQAYLEKERRKLYG